MNTSRLEAAAPAPALLKLSYFRLLDRTGEPGHDAVRDVRLDLGRCLGALAVIYLHCADRYTWSGGLARGFAYVVYSYSLFCVPLFFMISGSLLIGRPIRSFSDFVRGRLLKVIKPFAFGAVFYLIWQIAYQRNSPVSVLSYTHELLAGVPYFHLWFLPALLSLYLLLPLFQGLSASTGQGVLGAAIILFVFNGIATYLVPLGLSLGLGDGLQLPYFLAGFCLSKIIVLDARMCRYALALVPLCTALLIGVSSAIAGHRAGFVFQEFASPLVVVQSLAVFSLLLQVEVPVSLVQVVQRFSPYTLGIYILHYAVMWMLTDFLVFLVHPTTTVIILIIPPTTFLVTYVLVRALHSVPGLKSFV